MYKAFGVSALAAMLAFAVTATAQTGAMVVKKAPGAVGAAGTATMTATIVAIDKATRTVVLKGPKGNEVELALGPDVRNFDQMKVGDHVKAKYMQALTLELKKGGGLLVHRTDSEGAVRARKGEMPAGAIEREVTVVADVVGVDAKTQTITLKGPMHTVELAVPDKEQFKHIKKGDQVEATYVEAVALDVSSPKK